MLIVNTIKCNVFNKIVYRINPFNKLISPKGRPLSRISVSKQYVIYVVSVGININLPHFKKLEFFIDFFYRFS